MHSVPASFTATQAISLETGDFDGSTNNRAGSAEAAPAGIFLQTLGRIARQPPAKTFAVTVAVGGLLTGSVPVFGVGLGLASVSILATLCVLQCEAADTRPNYFELIDSLFSMSMLTCSVLMGYGSGNSEQAT